MIVPDCMPQTLPVGNLQRTEIGLNFVLCPDTLSDHLEVQLPHAPQHSLPCLRVKSDPQPWILPLQFSQRTLQRFLSTLQLLFL